MSLRTIPFLGIGNVGKSPNVDAQQRTNLYVELQTDPEVASMAVYGTPGIAAVVNYGAWPTRGVRTFGNYKYVVNRSTLWQEDAAGNMVSKGTLLTDSGKVSMSDNGTQIIIMDGANGYIYNTSTDAFSQITADGFPGGTFVDFLNGRFIVCGNAKGQFNWSALYDGLTWDALDFANAESNPDDLVRDFVDGGQLYLFGTLTTEIWGDSGALDSPYARVGASGIEIGLAAPNSLCKFAGSLCFLARSRLGQVQIVTIAGYSVTPVSSPEVDFDINSYATFSDATAYSYLLGGHSMYQINFPTANTSWLYDGLTQAWSKLQYSTAGRHRGEIQFNFLDKSYVTDYANGKTYRLSADLLDDDGTPIVREIIGRHQVTGNYSRASKLWIDCEGGVGLLNGQGQDPQMMLQISRDGGHVWGEENWTSMGAMGQYIHRAQWNRLGQARDWLFKVRITDSVKVVLRACWAEFTT